MLVFGSAIATRKLQLADPADIFVNEKNEKP
jgi:hypothetical protein